MKPYLQITKKQEQADLLEGQHENYCSVFKTFEKCVEVAQKIIPISFEDEEIEVKVILNRHDENPIGKCSSIKLNDDGTIPEGTDLSEVPEIIVE